MFDWLGRKQASEPAVARSAPAVSAQAEAQQERQQRRSHREQLFVLVRQAMASTPLPVISYKFKVLSLDGAGQSFVVMVDLVGHPDGTAKALKTIEEVIVASAATNHDLQVKGVYWRFEAPTGAASAPVPAPHAEERNNPFALRAAAGAKPSDSVLEQLSRDEMLAFRKAQDSTRTRAPQAGAGQAGQEQAGRSAREGLAARLSDDDDFAKPSNLSPTQFGEL